MPNQDCDLTTVLTTNHPARPFLIIGGLITGLGLFRNSISGLGFMLVGGAIVMRGLEEMKRVEELHGGNFHGSNGPPANR